MRQALSWTRPTVRGRCRLTGATRRLRPSWLRLIPRRQRRCPSRTGGLGATEAVLVFEQLGRALVAGPLVGTFLAAGVVQSDVVGVVERGDGGTVVAHHGDLDASAPDLRCMPCRRSTKAPWAALPPPGSRRSCGGVLVYRRPTMSRSWPSTASAARATELTYVTSDAAIPVNTSGGGLCEAYVHGFNVLLEGDPPGSRHVAQPGLRSEALAGDEPQRRADGAVVFSRDAA